MSIEDNMTTGNCESTTSTVNTLTKSEDKVSAQIGDLKEEINKLLLMKAKNFITDKEFEKLKAHAIEKRLG